MEKTDNKIKYFLYARKSTESEDKQVASIEAQISELKKIASRENLNIVKIFSESKSAKAPGRPVFIEMIEKLNKGEADGILCWKINRLARNPIDGGTISWMLQNATITHIKTQDRSYYPTDNVLMMAVELGMANQFIRDLSTDTKRGLKTKAEKGWLPGRAPLGYLNNKYKDKGTKDIIKDPEKYGLVRRLWDLLLENRFPVQKIHRIATEDWGLTINGRVIRKLSRTETYRIFDNPFYYGKFRYAGKLYDGKHEPLITEEEFNKAQVILGKRSSPRAQTHSFAFTGLIRCGECTSMITAEEKTKNQKNGNIHHYAYYRCTKRKNKDCSQKTIRLEKLEKQILEILGKLEIPKEFHEWAMDVIRVENEKEFLDRSQIINTQQKQYNICIQKLDKLIDMRTAEEISEEEFKTKREELTREKSRLNQLLNDSDNQVNSWLEKADALFSFAETARSKFEKGSLDDKRAILTALGSNLSLKDKTLFISLEEPMLLVEKASSEVKTIHKRLEPLKRGSNKRILADLYSQNPILGA